LDFEGLKGDRIFSNNFLKFILIFAKNIGLSLSLGGFPKIGLDERDREFGQKEPKFSSIF
jgi:hypothetical protein